MGSRVEDRVAVLAEPIAGKLGLELVVVQYRKEGANWYLRIFIDKEGGVNVEDCSRMNDVLGKLLDEEDPIPTSYILEVSSPGIERPLIKKNDFIRFQGHNIRVKTYAPIAGRRNFSGLLQGLRDECIVVEVDGERLTVPLKGVAQAHLIADLWK